MRGVLSAPRIVISRIGLPAAALFLSPDWYIAQMIYDVFDVSHKDLPLCA